MKRAVTIYSFIFGLVYLIFFSFLQPWLRYIRHKLFFSQGLVLMYTFTVFNFGVCEHIHPLILPWPIWENEPGYKKGKTPVQ